MISAEEFNSEFLKYTSPKKKRLPELSKNIVEHSENFSVISEVNIEHQNLQEHYNTVDSFFRNTQPLMADQKK